MTKPAPIDHDTTVSASTTSMIIQGHAVHRITFLHTHGDYVYNQADNDTIVLKESIQTTIADQAQGTHINIDPFSLLTTVQDFQFDRRGVIDLTTKSFTSMAAIAKSLEVIPGYGTVLGAQFHGPIVMSFPGDYDVKLSQFHLHPA